MMKYRTLSQHYRKMMAVGLLCVLCSIHSVVTHAQVVFRPFQMTWSITTESDRIEFMTNSEDFIVAWENKNDPSQKGTANFNLEASIESLPIGIYNVSVYPGTDAIGSIQVSSERLLSIDQWGDIEWTSMSYAFVNCSEMTLAATDTPNFGAVTDMAGMFVGAIKFDGDLSDWDVSNVKDMSYMFALAILFNGNISTWNVSKVENFSNMFYYAGSFNQSLGNWQFHENANIENLLVGSMIDCAALSQTIIGWAANSATPSNMKIDFDGLSYGSGAKPAYDYLLAKGWTIVLPYREDACYITSLQTGNWEENTTWSSPLVNSSSIAVQNNHTVTLTGNTTIEQLFIEGRLKGTGTITGKVINQESGIIAPGQSAGCMSYEGDFINKGTLELEINGKTACGEFDQLVVNGVATLGGNLEIMINYTPSEMDVITILQATALIGRFTSAPALPDDWHLRYNYPSEGQVSLVYSTTLPVELIYFKANPLDQGVVVEWATSSETNNLGFSIERSTDGHRWQAVGFVTANSSSIVHKNYAFKDTLVYQTTYYRLKQIDLDGSFHYSPMVAVIATTPIPEITVYPNPTTSYLQFSNLEQNTLRQIKIFDSNGNNLGVYTQSDLKFGRIDVSHLTSGIYILQIEGIGVKWARNFVKR